MEERQVIVPFYQVPFNDRELEEVVRVVSRGYLTQGKETRFFEKLFRDFVGSRYAIAVDSCTSGLFLSLKYNGIGKGETVTIPSLTFASVANVILHCGAEIKWEDDVYVGKAYYMKNDRPFKVVDSAHQLERGIYRDFLDSLMCFSFYPTKLLASAEGGMICTNDHYAMEWLEKARWHGRKGGGYQYTIDMAGWKMNMTDVQAAIGIVQLKKLDGLNARRKAIVEYYNRELGEKCESLHLYTIDVDNRDDFLSFMDKNGVNCSVHFYTPLHLQPAYKEFKRELPYTEQIAKRIVSLPLFPTMRDEQLNLVIRLVKIWRDNDGKPRED